MSDVIEIPNYFSRYSNRECKKCGFGNNNVNVLKQFPDMRDLEPHQTRAFRIPLPTTIQIVV